MSELTGKVYPKRMSWAYALPGEYPQDGTEGLDRIRRFMVCEVTREMFGSTVPEDLVAVEAASCVSRHESTLYYCSYFRLDVDVLKLLEYLPREKWRHLEVKDISDEGLR